MAFQYRLRGFEGATGQFGRVKGTGHVHQCLFVQQESAKPAAKSVTEVWQELLMCEMAHATAGAEGMGCGSLS